MARYVLERVLQTIPLFLVASVLVFFMIRILPGGPVVALLGEDASLETVEAMRDHLGLDRPLHVQYLIWIRQCLRGDFGVSFLSNMPVVELLRLKFLATAQLVAGAFVVAATISLPLGILSAVKRGSWLDRFAMAYSAVGIAMPSYWLGILLVLLFGVRLRWLPTSGYTPFAEDPGQALGLLILPAFTMGTGIAAVQVRFVRSALLEVLDKDYVRTARAKGLRERVVIGRHALKNAFISVVTVLGLQVGAFLRGAVVTESLFNWPGMGRLLLEAITQRDYAVVQANILFLLAVFVGVNLAVDLTYAWLDPRIRFR